MCQARSSSPMLESTSLSLIMAFKLSAPYSAAVTIDIVGSKRRASSPFLMLATTWLLLVTILFWRAALLRTFPGRQAMSHQVLSRNCVRPPALVLLLLDFASQTPAS